MNNNVSRILKVIAIVIFVIGFFSGFLLGAQFPTTNITGRVEGVFNYGLLLLTWAFALITGMFFVALSEIINLLQKSIVLLKESKYAKT